MTDEYEGPERRTYGWHLRKEINAGHLLTTVAIAGALLVTWTQFNVRMALVEDRLTRQVDIDRAQDVASREAVARVDTRLGGMESKLDKLIDWQIRRHAMHREPAQ